MPLSATMTQSRGAGGDELELSSAIDRERREIARVDSDHGCVQPASAYELRDVVGLDERVQAEVGGNADESAPSLVVQVAKDEQDGVGAGLAGDAQILFGREEPFGEQGQTRRRPSGTEVVPGAVEAGVDQDRDRGGSRSLVRSRELRGIRASP